MLDFALVLPLQQGIGPAIQFDAEIVVAVGGHVPRRTGAAGQRGLPTVHQDGAEPCCFEACEEAPVLGKGHLETGVVLLDEFMPRPLAGALAQALRQLLGRAEKAVRSQARASSRSGPLLRELSKAEQLCLRPVADQQLSKQI